MKRFRTVALFLSAIASLMYASSLTLIYGPRVAHAQAPQSPPPVAEQGLAATLAVTAASARVQLPSSVTTFPVVLVINNGTKDAFVRFGTVASVAVTTDIPVPTGHAIALYTSGTNVYLAAICGGTDTTSLYLIQFNGQPFYR